MNPRAAINDLLPFQGSPFGQLGYFSKLPYAIASFFQKRFILYRVVFYLSRTFLTFQKFLFSSNSGESGIRTHAPLRTNGFQDRLVMTTSIPLHLFICLPLPYHLSDKMYSITAFHCRQHLFQTFFIFLYFSYFPVFFIYKYTYFSLFIHRTCHLQLLLHILISTEPTIGKFFQMHGNSQIPAQDY